MASLDVIKDYFLKVVLEESDKFNFLSEEEKQKSLENITKLSELEQRNLCKDFVKKEKETLPSKIFMRFIGKVSNSLTALSNIAAKDRAILEKYKNGRSNESSQSI